MKKADKSIVESIKEIKALSQALDDPEFDSAMEIVINCINQPEIPPLMVSKVITQLSALSVKFAMASTWYKTIGREGQAEIMKKDIYYTARYAVDSLVDSLKYQQRATERRF